MQKPARVFTLFIFIALVIAVAGWYYTKTLHPTNRASEPQQTAEEVLSERALQAGKSLQTPLGKAVIEKRFDEINHLYRPREDLILLSEIVRALFVENKISQFLPHEQDKLLYLLLSSVDQLEDKNLHLFGLSFTQIIRLPTPSHEKASYAILKRWLDKEGPKKTCALEKLALQDLSPEPKTINLFRQSMILPQAIDSVNEGWIQKLDLMRNQEEQKRSAQFLLKNFKKLSQSARAQAVVSLSHHFEIAPSEIKSLAMEQLNSSELSHLESGLRASSNLLKAHQFTDQEQIKLAKILTDLPSKISSPFTQAKVQEMLTLIHK